jgi:hypothetical protein
MLNHFAVKCVSLTGVILLVLTFAIIGTNAQINASNQTINLTNTQTIKFSEMGDREAVIGLHEDPVTFAQLDCILCHGTRYDERAPHDNSILSAHAIMLQLVSPPRPGSNNLITPDTCRQCHKTVDLIEESAIYLRKQVSLEAPTLLGFSCMRCHDGTIGEAFFAEPITSVNPRIWNKYH